MRLRYEVAYTPKMENPLEKDENGNFLAHQNRDYIPCKNYEWALKCVDGLLKDGAFDIFIDGYDKENNLRLYKGFNQLT